MAKQIQGPKDLFLYDLCAMYDIEKKMARMLPIFAQECLDNQGRYDMGWPKPPLV